jgi:primase-polymerase (primpol)-like protein
MRIIPGRGDAPGRLKSRRALVGKLPAALAEYSSDQKWVVWRRLTRDGKPTKVPYDPKTGRKADATDPTTWGTLDEAEEAFQRSQERRWPYNGIGFVLADDDPFTGVDIDHCIGKNGEIHPAAQTIVERLNSYTERTPSGDGLRVWVKARMPGDKHKKAIAPGVTVEIYDARRYFTVTGDQLEGTPDDIL